MKRWFESTTKVLVWWFAVHSTVWVYLSYLLAVIGRADIAESLSKVIVTEIIAVLLLYIVSKTVENVFKYNDFSGVKKKKTDGKAGKRDC